MQLTVHAYNLLAADDLSSDHKNSRPNSIRVNACKHQLVNTLLNPSTAMASRQILYPVLVGWVSLGNIKHMHHWLSPSAFA
jgi:hypothetical protein